MSLIFVTAVQRLLPMLEVLKRIPDCIESMARQFGLLAAPLIIFFHLQSTNARI